MDVKPKKVAECEKLIPLSTFLMSSSPQSLNDTKCFTNLKVTINVIENQNLKLLKIWDTMRCFIFQQFPQSAVSVSWKFNVFDAFIDLASVTVLLLD